MLKNIDLSDKELQKEHVNLAWQWYKTKMEGMQVSVIRTKAPTINQIDNVLKHNKIATERRAGNELAIIKDIQKDIENKSLGIIDDEEIKASELKEKIDTNVGAW